MSELLRSEDSTPSGVLTGLDDGDPEHVFFHDAEQRRKGDSGGNDEQEGTKLLLYGHLAAFQAAVRLNVKELFLCC
jgi:hypothetical protein